LWWGVHLLFMLSSLTVLWGLPLASAATYLSLLGVRILPGLFYFFSPAWWFMGMLLQLYLVYPLLWEGLRRRGPLWLLLVACGISFAVRGVGLYWFTGYLDAWQRGAIFVTRLPEFVFGISLAAAMRRAPEQTETLLRSPKTLALALILYILGTVLSFTLLGMVIAPFLLGVGAFALLHSALTRGVGAEARGRLLPWVGRHSYSLYLVHHPLVLLFVPAGSGSGRNPALGIALALSLTVALAVVLERAVQATAALLSRSLQQRGGVRAAARVAVMAAAVGFLLGTEWAVRRMAPQEVLGWGERPSLEPHPTFGWRLIPSRETRLRWESYDYRVTANALGFPGPDHPVEAEPGTFRILATGDAFTSAEGVDTDRAWPRMLEAELAARSQDRKVEVMNFAVTGYGPSQFAAVVEEFAPVYRPRLILVQFFVNEYLDVLGSNDDFRKRIGFGLPPPDGWHSTLRLAHLRRLLGLQISDRLRAALKGGPSYPKGYSYGAFSALERERAGTHATGRGMVSQCLSRIKRVADLAGANVALVMVPASVQVCRPDDLPYYPGNVDLADGNRFDPDLPQRMTREITEPLGFAFVDLRPLLRSLAPCPYQPHNMHWTVAGHQAVARFLAGTLVVPATMEH
jgi:peptidoglycan/LPS O-acetylase OafA/YrhL